jgi:hypothetical protein
MLASGLCLLHCLAFPVLIALFPFVAPAGDSETFHGAMVGLALVAALLALAPGYLTHPAWQAPCLYSVPATVKQPRPC